MKRANEFEGFHSPTRTRSYFADCWTFQPLSGTRSITSAEPTPKTRTAMFGKIGGYHGRYSGTLGASTVQQIERKNHEAWQAFFALKKKSEANSKHGFWGYAGEGRELRAYIHNTSYSVELVEYS